MHIPATMRAMVLTKFGGEPVGSGTPGSQASASAAALLEERELPVPAIGPRDVLVRVRAVGVCGTDLKITAGKIKGVPLPHIPGHEPAGEVAAIGTAVTEVSVGDHVGVVIFLNCGECVYCQTGREQICPHMAGRIGFTIDGAYAEYLKVPVSHVVVVPPSIPFEHIALLGDCLTTAWHALTRRANVQAGDWVYMTGAGGIGLHAIQVAKLLGARVAVVDVDEEKLRLAREFGADLALHVARDDVVGMVRAATGGAGVEVAMDFVSTQPALDRDFALLRPDGALVLIGYTPDQLSTFRTMDVVLNDFRIIGSRASGRQEFTEVIDLLSAGRLTPVVSRTYALAEVNTALEDLRNGGIIGRAVVIP